MSAGVIASLAGIDQEALRTAMRDFKSGARAGTVMPEIARGYSDDEIDAIAAWFAPLQPRDRARAR
jgi:cytochrome c553